MAKTPHILRLEAENPDPAAIEEAVAALSQGGLVIIPTGTVYGLAADPRVPGAFARLCRAKNRPANKPIAYFVPDTAYLENRGVEFGPAGRLLANRFWPGPLTMVLTVAGELRGYRVPSHPVPLALLREMKTTLAVTSANRSGGSETITADAAIEQMETPVELVLDAGPAAGTIPSTVVRVVDNHVTILRNGVISEEDIQSAVSGAEERICVSPERKTVLFVCTGNVCRSSMAEYLLRHRLGRDTGWHVESAGVAAASGAPASEGAEETMREIGIDISPHRSRPISAELVDAARLIVVMTSAHRSEIMRRFPEASGKVFIMRSFGTESETEDVPDPMGLSVAAYRKIRNELDSAVSDLILYMKEN